MNKQKDGECSPRPSNWMCNSEMANRVFDAPWSQEIVEVNATLNDTAQLRKGQEGWEVKKEEVS